MGLGGGCGLGVGLMLGVARLGQPQACCVGPGWWVPADTDRSSAGEFPVAVALAMQGTGCSRGRLRGGGGGVGRACCAECQVVWSLCVRLASEGNSWRMQQAMR